MCPKLQYCCCICRNDTSSMLMNFKVGSAFCSANQEIWTHCERSFSSVILFWSFILWFYYFVTFNVPDSCHNFPVMLSLSHWVFVWLRFNSVPFLSRTWNSRPLSYNRSKKNWNSINMLIWFNTYVKKAVLKILFFSVKGKKKSDVQWNTKPFGLLLNDISASVCHLHLELWRSC